MLRISIADCPSRCIADRGTAEAAAQQQQHSSSDGSDVAATDDKDERGYTGELFVVVLALFFAQFEKDERGQIAKSLVNHCCFAVPLNTLRLHTRLTAVYLFTLRFSGALSNISGCRSRVAPCKQ